MAILQLFAINTLDLCSSGVTLQGVGLPLGRMHCVVVDTVVRCGLTACAVLSKSLQGVLGDSLSLIIVWLARWCAIYLVDRTLRRGRYDSRSLFSTGGGRRRRPLGLGARPPAGPPEGVPPAARGLAGRRLRCLMGENLGLPAPPGGPLSGPRAGFWVRLLALLIDGALLTVVVLLVGRGSTSVGIQLLAAALGMVYFTAAVGSGPGQTLGARLVGIRVVDARTGQPIGYGRAFRRWLVTFLLGWLIVPYLWMLWDAERQTWQDKLADDVVVPANRVQTQLG